MNIHWGILGCIFLFELRVCKGQCRDESCTEFRRWFGCLGIWWLFWWRWRAHWSIGDARAAPRNDSFKVESKNAAAESKTDIFGINARLAQGGTGIVFAGTLKAKHTPVALKRILEKEFDQKLVTQFFKEFEILKRCQHANVVTVFSAYEVPIPAFTMELLGKTLEQPTAEQHIDNDSVLLAFKNAAAAVQYLHSVNIAHRDIKPHFSCHVHSNSWEIKLIDFDAAEELKESAEFVQLQSWDSNFVNFVKTKQIQKGYERILKAKRRLKHEHSLRYSWMYFFWIKSLQRTMQRRVLQLRLMLPPPQIFLRCSMHGRRGKWLTWTFLRLGRHSKRLFVTEVRPWLIHSDTNSGQSKSGFCIPTRTCSRLGWGFLADDGWGTSSQRNHTNHKFIATQITQIASIPPIKPLPDAAHHCCSVNL